MEPMDDQQQQGVHVSGCFYCRVLFPDENDPCPECKERAEDNDECVYVTNSVDFIAVPVTASAFDDFVKALESRVELFSDADAFEARETEIRLARGVRFARRGRYFWIAGAVSMMVLVV